MDGLLNNKITKKEGKYYLLMECSVSTNQRVMIYLHAADVNYQDDCWLGVTTKDIPAA